MKGFQIVSKIGEGSFAQVFRVKRKEDGVTYAMKKIHIKNAHQRDIANCLNEVRILASISSPYILRYREAFYNQSSGHLCLITQYADGGDLTAMIESAKRRKERIPEETIWKLSFQILNGLKHLHKMGIIHRDVKSANVLLNKSENTAKIADMNVSKLSKTGLASTMAGTPYYTSPQVWSDQPYNNKCDIWSLGCVIYQLASLRPPFLGNDIPSLRNRILSGKFDRIPTEYSNELEEFIRQCLTVSLRSRPSAETLLNSRCLRRRIYLFPNEKFSLQIIEENGKQNSLLQTIKAPPRAQFAELKYKLPRSNYTSEVRGSKSLSVEEKCGSRERLVQQKKIENGRENLVGKGCLLPRILYLR